MTKKEWCRRFSQKVQQKMLAEGISQRDLAQLTKIPENTLGRYVSGSTIPRVDKIINIAKALNCSILELIQFGEMVV